MPLPFRSATLENGLSIIGEVDARAHTAAIGFFVKTGARDETAAEMGVSHFLEHMMFKGTDRRPAAQVDRDFDDIGAQHNAFTTSEMTAFWARCLPEHLPRAEEILADIMRPAIRPADFDDEKKVILEEIAMYHDNPFWELYERAMEEYYGQHPLAHRVLGTEETIGALRRESMIRYFEERYSADNTVVALAGRIDFDAMVERVRGHCGSWRRSGATRRHRDHSPRPRSFTIDSAMAVNHYLLMLAPAPAIDDDRRYAASLLMQVLGDVDGSRLYWALVDTGLADEAQAHYDGRDGLGEYLIHCTCAPDRAETVEAIATEEIEKLVESLTDDDLLRVCSRAATSATLHGELPSGRMRRLGRVWTYTGRHLSLEDELERLRAVTLDEMRSVASEFAPRPVVVGRLHPL
jgi:predicted Zn-dependent peptidase